MALTQADFENWISLCEAPGQADAFFLGVADSRITFYSQQVRALRLVHSLSETHRLQPNERVAVIGGGAAGLTAAAAFAVAGARVSVFESTHHLLALQVGSTRLLHPRLYDWPATESRDERATLPLLSWSRGPAGVVVGGLAAQFEALRVCPEMQLEAQVDRAVTGLIRRGKGGWSVTFAAAAGQHFDKVVLAIGFGEEVETEGCERRRYWELTDAPSPGAEVAQAAYFVSGTGDGGLTDVLSVLVQGFDHLQFTESFLALFTGSALTEAVERALALDTGADLEPAFEAEVLPVLEERGAVHYLAQRLRADRQVTFNALTKNWLPAGEAAPLNQLMAYALIKAAEPQGQLCRSFGSVKRVATRSDGRLEVMGQPAPDTPFDVVILRHGPDKPARYEAFKEFYDGYSAHHAAFLAANPELRQPPRLDEETFAFFDKLADRCHDEAAQAARADRRRTQARTIVVSVDEATGKPTQRGVVDIQLLADQLGHLPHHVSIQLDVRPEALGPLAGQLVRLEKASVNQIRLCATESVRGPWRALAPAVDHCAALLETPYRSHALPQATEIGQRMDAYLSQQLSLRVGTVLATGHCPGLCEIHPTIIPHLQATWHDWELALNASDDLRTAFLQLLWRVREDGDEPWPGEHHALERLTAALVLTVAVQIGVAALQPQIGAKGGNLGFGSANEAVGSCCASVKGNAIDDCGDPAIWSVDALILSEARELLFPEGGPGLVDAGTVGSASLSRATRVAPAVIKNNQTWRAALQAGLVPWRTAVEAELDRWRQRQDAQLSGDAE